MRKIGIVTWYKNGNYGGTLQAFAMMKTLQKLNCSAEFINYDKDNSIVRVIRDTAFHLLFPKSALSRDAIYRFVKNEFLQSPKHGDIETLRVYGEKFDKVLCGSDQIWSSLNGADPVYFLQFVPENKRIAYAPSIGIPQIAEPYLDDFIKYVKSIPHISVREKHGVDYIRTVAGIEAKQVLDPTFLLNGDEWREFSSERILQQKKLTPKGYVLCYFLGDDNNYTSFVNAFSEKAKLPTFYVSSKRKNYENQQLICDPAEFLGLINNAAYVLTDSFHGMALSINMGTKVGAFRRFKQEDKLNQNSRLLSILDLLDCHDILLSNDALPDELIVQKDRSVATYAKLNELRQDSINYLINALGIQ